MTAHDAPTPPGDATKGPEPAPDRPVRHRGDAIRFVAVFVVAVLAMLVGYRYAIDTAANDWYLFQVARHTAWVLDAVGYRADLEKTTGGRLNPREVRASLRGGVPDDAPDSGGEVHVAPRLTPWEIWRFRAREARHNPEPDPVIGPQVVFVLEPGLTHQIAALESALELPPGGDPHTLAAPRFQAAQSRLDTLRKQRSEGLADPGLRRSQRGRQFTFVVIPECGAIEVMAIFIAAVLAFPAPWAARARALAVGLPILYGVNILRLACLAYIGAIDSSGEWFAFCHEYVWQAVYVIFVVVLWLGWVEIGVRRPAA